MKTTDKSAPELRFSGFVEPYTIKRIDALLNKCSNSVAVKETREYQQIGIRSHGKGIFHKSFVTGADLGNKRVFWVKENTFILNIVFAWEQAVAKTSLFEKGMIASHRFPMYNPVKGLTDIDYILYFFLTKKGKHLLGIASPGGAGRNKTLGQKTFEDLKISIPTLPEQQKIASFLSAVDKKIEKLTRKKELLETYKKGVMQKVFSREIRFKDDDGKDFPDWEEKQLGEIADFFKGKGISKAEIEVSGKTKCIRYGELYTYYSEVISEIKSATNAEISKLFLSKRNDVLIPSSGETNIDIATSSCINMDGVALGGDINVIRTKQNGIFLSYYLNNARRNEIAKLAQGISVIHLYSNHLKILKILLPSLNEQKKISTLLSTIDNKIQATQTQLTKTQAFKKGLFQKMFV